MNVGAAETLAFTSIAEIAPRIKRGEVSPVALTCALLARIETFDGVLKSYITVMAQSALDQAEQAERDIRAGRYRGPLHGIPVGIKDLYATKGVTTTFGSPLYADWVPDHDAAAVERLTAAGAIILGKTNLHELAFGTTSANAHYGVVANPWDISCHPGGSSGGSAAAVAAGLAFAAMGSDTGASIRQPAACCGLVGLKPTYGRVSKYGALPLSWSMDHAGPLTRTVRDTALVMNALAGYDPRDRGSVDVPVPDYDQALSGDLRGKIIGVARDLFFEDCDTDVVRAVEEAIDVFRDKGATIRNIVLPDMRSAGAGGSVIMFSEAAAYHAEHMKKRAGDISTEIMALLKMGAFYSSVQYVQAQRLRQALMVKTNQALRPFDAIIMPTSPVPATNPAEDPPGHSALRPRNTTPFNFISLPAVSVPCGFTAKGLPVGLQIVGKAFDEAGVLDIAYGYEQAAGWHRERPDLSALATG